MANTSNGKHRINFLDFLLIVLMIALVSAAIVSVISANPNKISGGDSTIIYTIRCEGIDKGIAEKLQIGDSVYDNGSNQLLGTIVEQPKVTPITATKEGTNELIETDKINMSITITAQAWNDSGIFSIDNFMITVGRTVEFHSESVSASGICIGINSREA